MQTSLFKITGKSRIQVVADVDDDGILVPTDLDEWDDNGVIKTDIPSGLSKGDYAFWTCGRIKVRYLDRHPPTKIESVDDTKSLDELVSALIDGLSGVVLDNCSYIFYIGTRIGRNGKDGIYCPREILCEAKDGSVHLIDGVENLAVCHVEKEDIVDMEGVRFWKDINTPPFELETYAINSYGKDQDSQLINMIDNLQLELDKIKTQFNKIKNSHILVSKLESDIEKLKVKVNDSPKITPEPNRDFETYKLGIDKRLSRMDQRFDELYNVIMTMQSGFVSGKTPPDMQISTTFDYDDIIQCITDNLNAVGCPLNQTTKLLSTVLFAASKSCRPVLLIGDKTTEIVNALSIAVYGKTAGHMRYSPGTSYVSLSSFSRTDNVIVCDGFMPEDAESVINALGIRAGNDKLLCFTCPQRVATRLLEGFQRISMPIFIDYFKAKSAKADTAMKSVRYNGIPIQYRLAENTQFVSEFKEFFPDIYYGIVSPIVSYAITFASIEHLSRDILAIFGYAQYAFALQDRDVMSSILQLPQLTASTIDWLQKLAKQFQTPYSES